MDTKNATGSGQGHKDPQPGRTAAHEPLESGTGEHNFFAQLCSKLSKDRQAVSFITALSRSITPAMPNYELLAKGKSASNALVLLAKRIAEIYRDSPPHGSMASQAALRAICGPRLDEGSLSLLLSAALRSSEMHTGLCINTISDMAEKGILSCAGVGGTLDSFVIRTDANEVYPFLLVSDAALSNPHMPQGSITIAVLSDIHDAVSAFCRNSPGSSLPIEVLNMAAYLEIMSFQVHTHADSPAHEPSAAAGENAIKQMIKMMQGKP
jgi:hypothetical protein